MTQRYLNAVGLSTVVSILAILHDVPDARREALIARLRNLQRLGFPEMPDRGSARRAYWPDHVAQILVAFEFLRYGVPQGVAGPAVAASRSEVLSAFRLASERLTDGGETATPEVPLLLLEANAFLDDAKQVRSDVRVVPVSPEQQEPGATRAGTVLSIDPVQVVLEAANAARRTDEPFDVSFFRSA